MPLRHEARAEARELREDEPHPVRLLPAGPQLRQGALVGAELYLQRLIAALVAAGHEVHLYAEHWEGAPAAVTLHRVPVKAPRSLRPVRFAEAVARMMAPIMATSRMTAAISTGYRYSV